MSLDQTLAEVEPILRGTDGTFQFSHPSFQEILTARQFADEINSGRLPVKEAFINFWSYEEDAELWGVQGRNLIFGWERIISFVVGFLDESFNDEIVRLATASHAHLIEKQIEEKERRKSNCPSEDQLYKECEGKWYAGGAPPGSLTFLDFMHYLMIRDARMQPGYNPFFDDLCFISRLSRLPTICESTRNYLANLVYTTYEVIRGSRSGSEIEVDLRKECIGMIGTIPHKKAQDLLQQIAWAKEQYYHGDPEGPHDYSPYHFAEDMLRGYKSSGEPLEWSLPKTSSVRFRGSLVRTRPKEEDVIAIVGSNSPQDVRRYIVKANTNPVNRDDYRLRILHGFLRPIKQG